MFLISFKGKISLKTLYKNNADMLGQFASANIVIHTWVGNLQLPKKIWYLKSFGEYLDDQFGLI